MNRIFSGVQPTGNLHLGNYLGAIRNFVRLQDNYECIYCVVDMHAITVRHDPMQLRTQTREIAAAYLAAGIDPHRSIIFNQGANPDHAKLSWIFNCVARVGWLDRMTQFKEKVGKDRENASVGLYLYPVLMAADILLYKATHVPVGEDQKQHLELTRDIAQKFNHDFGQKAFPQPEPLILGPATRIMSLRDGTKKMSKTDPSDQSRINITDDADTIAHKIKRAKTDPHPLPGVECLDAKGTIKREDEKVRPEAFNLLSIYAALTEEDMASVISKFAGQSFSSFKDTLAEVAIDKLSPIATRMQELMAAPDHIDDILRRGTERARAISAPILAETEEIVGFLRF